MIRRKVILFFICFLAISCLTEAQSFVQRKGPQFILNNKPYYYIGANYWYGGLLGLETDAAKGVGRLRDELDFLRSKGVSNLRVMVGSEGSGQINGVQRVSPPVQTAKGVFAVQNLKGLDMLLSEMSKRNMKAILFLSNNWEWSGGFLQYLNWNGLLPDSILRRKLNWDEMRDYVSKFYSCKTCINDYNKQLAFIINHINSVSGVKYASEPAIMAWELANEPRPMRPAANEAYKKFIAASAAYIKGLDKNHLITLGTEGEMGTESLDLFEAIHADKNVDYSTIHIWPKNWGWFRDTAIQSSLSFVINNTTAYIKKHIAAAQKIGKPLVIEEFGLPRDGHIFSNTATTTARDNYYENIFSIWKEQVADNDVLAGVNFWGFGGTARPIAGQTFWKPGDNYTGDPPMEEQGLNSVFDTDTSTWKIIYNYTSSTNVANAVAMQPSDKNATKETKALYKNLNALLKKGIMFGHQDDLAYGVNWKYVENKSDVKEVVGDYPAVYGWELGNLEHDLPYNLDSVPFNKMHHFIQQAYERGGITTISWHADNPINGESAWNTAPNGVSSILPGGSRHELYKAWLDKIATFLGNLKGKNGEMIPILFRPFHELSGNWFWWGPRYCTPAEFKLLWRFTINYLRDVKGLHHLLYIFNTAGDFNSETEFMERYPGNDMVDLVSFDTYQGGNPERDSSFLKALDRRLTIIEKVAQQQNKIPTIGEAGFESIPYAAWWTKTLWPAMANHHISYVLIWRNFGRQPNGHMHYYVPTVGDVSAEDFKKFYNLDRTLFEKDIAKEKLYTVHEINK